ncbi:helix-turn-helix domain-containing protein [Nocardia sp. NPDC127579]|uniref:helix-turn-helix domain-containing protein n=1 Tax=Nocardia sp. NPDC127579 TaxID=3345402 RepID=UPI00362839D9
MTSTADEARQALGLRLRELRRDAGITGRKIADLAGWHESKVSKIEYGKQTPSEDDLRAWCTHTGHPDELPDLIATVRNIRAAYLEFQRVLGTGTRRRQRTLVRTEGETTLMRWYEPSIIPGLLQTENYIRWILGRIIEFYGIPDDLDAGVSARIARQEVLYQRDHRFAFVIAEQTLRTTAWDNAVMVAQLDRLLTVMASMPHVTLRIVPAHARYEGPATNGFVLYDTRLVIVETASAELSITQPREIAVYGRLFNTLVAQSVGGDEARSLIASALEQRRAIPTKE